QLNGAFGIAFDIKSNGAFLDSYEQEHFAFDLVHDVVRAKRLSLLHEGQGHTEVANFV
ncbi:MAG: hypothetical protein RIQ98_1184, partial [Bacteroidota bacterium]